MAASSEVWSFVNKFLQLSSCGLHADMHLRSSAGKISVTLQTEVDIFAISDMNGKRVSKGKPPSPSRLRRRERRKNARNSNDRCASGHVESNVAGEADYFISTEEFDTKQSELNDEHINGLDTDKVQPTLVDTPLTTVIESSLPSPVYPFCAATASTPYEPNDGLSELSWMDRLENLPQPTI